MGFNGIYLTTKGSALLAKTQTGIPLEFTGFQIGEAYMPDGHVITNTTALFDVAPKTMEISGVTSTATQATVKAQITNSTFASAFTWREVGVFANDPDEGDILYAYGNARDEADVIPSNATPTEFLFNIIMKIYSDTTVDITIDKSLVFITQSEFETIASGLDEKEALVDDDLFLIADSEDTNQTKKSKWGNIKNLVEDLFLPTSNKNILDNWDFRKPVNQRGLTTYTAAATRGYTIDRWTIEAVGLTLTVGDGFITLTNSGAGLGYFRQHLENGNLYHGKALMFSVDVKEYTGTTNMIIYSASGSSVSKQITTAGINAANEDSFQYGASFQTVLSIAAGASISLYTAKLEIGEVSTLINDPPAKYVEELAKCLNHCWEVRNDTAETQSYFLAAAAAETVNTLQSTIRFPVKMRIPPTLTISGTFKNMATNADMSFLTHIVTQDMAVIRAAWGASLGYAAHIGFAPGAKMTFSSDL